MNRPPAVRLRYVWPLLVGLACGLISLVLNALLGQWAAWVWLAVVCCVASFIVVSITLENRQFEKNRKH